MSRFRKILLIIAGVVIILIIVCVVVIVVSAFVGTEFIFDYVNISVIIIFMILCIFPSSFPFVETSFGFVAIFDSVIVGIVIIYTYIVIVFSFDVNIIIIIIIIIIFGVVAQRNQYGRWNGCLYLLDLFSQPITFLVSKFRKKINKK